MKVTSTKKSSPYRAGELGFLPLTGPFLWVNCCAVKVDVKYSKRELERAVREEKTRLLVERRQLVARLSEIDSRLEELGKAEVLLEGD